MKILFQIGKFGWITALKHKLGLECFRQVLTYQILLITNYFWLISIIKVYEAFIPGDY